jgi:AcrR family transcriptional regulator
MSQPKMDRRVMRTQQSLRDALIELMLEKPYEKITIQEIIDRANVGRATFYNHYLDKDDLLLRGVAELAQNQADEDSGQPVHNQKPERLPNTLQTAGMFRHSQQNKRIHKVLFKRNRENVIQEEISAILYAQVEERLAQLKTADTDLPVPMPILAHFISGGLWSLINWWHENDFLYTPEEMDAFFQKIAMPGTLKLLGKE